MATDPRSLAPGSWLSVRAWLDVDGTHVWVAHDCATERITAMLPFPVWHSDGQAVQPSIQCDGCGVHTHVLLGVPDDEYRCMETFQLDGRWCERMKGHGGTHHGGLIEWGTYQREVE